MPQKYSPEQSARNVALRREKRKDDDYRESANQLERDRWARVSPEQKARKNALRKERRKSDEVRKREAQLERERLARMSPEQKAAHNARVYALAKPHHNEYIRRWRHKMSPEKKRAFLDRANEWRRNSPERLAKERLNDLKKRYGLSMAAFDALLLKQGYCCAICQTNMPGGNGKNTWRVDHDHTTGYVRGLLCHHCNLALGHVSDSIKILKRAIEYLALSSKPQTG